MRENLLKTIGPGLIFAAAAVGVSHLVQSTRAGASFGLGLIAWIVLANLIKYPAFRFGPEYAAATGTSLLEGYRRQGKWALVLYALLTLGTMFSVQAGVTVVTAALASALGLGSNPVVISGVILALCAAILAVGKFKWLDRIVKVLVAIFTVTTVLATLLVLPKISWGEIPFWIAPADFDLKTTLFLAALIGWMPSAIDVAVWNSLWTLAKNNESQHKANTHEAILDFHVGYFGTVALALSFVLLGAGVMYASDISFAESAGGFASQILDLYAQTLGEWARPLIGVCALVVMFSTTLTVLDGFPRAITTLIDRFQSEEVQDTPDRSGGRAYWVTVLVQALGALLILHLFLRGLPQLIDIATTLSFLTAPALAVLNHRAMYRENVPEELRPKGWLRALSLFGIAALSLFALVYLYLIL
ncbi:divalent metal cation transporter [Microvenator marinus]|uniref:Divalent metal cation transporter n=1 Tax=Microvenator marinus TaxID=2600177 RepID=A0A5B8XWH2_9DELT|nr:divalent metal cation transporter [Microvenator marinus]QED29774.1 divalent metal cation transporter [Microvenator marinus]